jgi:NTE family protein
MPRFRSGTGLGRVSGRGVALVLAGGGARGAYEAGAVSVLLPALERRGERPSLLVGASVGAINTAFLASAHDSGAEEAAAGLLARWRDVTKGRVVRPILTRQAPLVALRYAGEILSLPGVRLPSLLDPRPLEGNLERWIDWTALRRSVDERRLDAIAVVATAARSGRSVGFCDGCFERELHRSHVIDYVRAELAAEHVRASAAIPILFPPVRVERPREARGWYFDGGTRLNTPLKPALDLGAERVVVVGTESIAAPSREDGRHDGEPPDFGDGALHMLQGALVDPLVEDLRMLGDVNTFFAEGAPAAQRYREVRGKPPYRRVPYVFVGPPRRGAIGELAMEVFRSRYGGLKGLRSPDFPLLNRLLGGESPTHGELLSYLFFDPEFIEALSELGRADAERWLRLPPGPEDPWQVEPLQAFVDPQPAPA